MADSVDRVFGHALNTVNKIRPGSQKPPSADRLALYGLYKQAMEGDVALVADRPKASQPTGASDYVRREQEKWDAWKANEGLGRTEAKRRYIERLIAAMRQYASTTAEARELVEELEFVWDQIKNNSPPVPGSEHGSSPRRQGQHHHHHKRVAGHREEDYLPTAADEHGGITASTAAMDPSGGGGGRGVGSRVNGLRVLSPVSQADEAEETERMLMAAADEEREEEEEFVDAPVSQVDEGDLNALSVAGDQGELSEGPFVAPTRRAAQVRADARWRRRVEASLTKLTTEIAALREQLESSRYVDQRRRYSFWGWALRIGWWAAQLVFGNAVILWIVVLYMRKKEDRRLEGAIRVLLGDAVASVQKVTPQVKMPALPRIVARKSTSPKD